MTLEADVQKGWHDAIVELFDLDLSPITGNSNDKFYFTNQLKPDNTKIVWQGRTYEPLPIVSTGYERTTTGQIPQPQLTVANVMGTFTQVIAAYDDLVGAKVIRRRTLGKYLDGSPMADSTQEFPLDVFYIERKTAENSLSITWQLASVLDLEGLRLPRRVITQNHCQWKYRSSECGYTGAPVFNADDTVISVAGQSTAAVTVINAYNLVQQRKRELVQATNNLNLAIGEKENKCSTYTKLEERYKADAPPYSYATSYSAYWNGTVVQIGLTYRIGRKYNRIQFFGLDTYAIERWGTDVAGCNAATTALNTAQTNYNTAVSNLASAQSALTTAINNLPANDPIRQQDICGKRVNSCSLRFEDASLPFGGFPGAIKGRS